MWLSKRSAGGRVSSANIATTTIGGQVAAALSEGEQRGVPVYAPGGYCWRPRAGQSLLVVKCGAEGESPVAAGTAQSEAPEGMRAGEVYITSGGGAAVWLKNDGAVEITGDVKINGQAYVLCKCSG